MARNTVSIRLSPAEQQTLSAAAARAGVGLSVYLRLSGLEAAGGVSSEWRQTTVEPPVWAASLLKAVKRTVRLELRRGKKPRAAEEAPARVSRRARH